MSKSKEGMKLIFNNAIDNQENISFIGKLIEIMVTFINSLSLLY